MTTGLVVLIIGGILLGFECFTVFKGLETKEYIYGDEAHSIEHISYLSLYVFTIIIGVICNYELLPYSYFYFVLGCSSVLLYLHIRKERLK